MRESRSSCSSPDHFNHSYLGGSSFIPSNRSAPIPQIHRRRSQMLTTSEERSFEAHGALAELVAAFILRQDGIIRCVMAEYTRKAGIAEIRYSVTPDVGSFDLRDMSVVRIRASHQRPGATTIAWRIQWGAPAREKQTATFLTRL